MAARVLAALALLVGLAEASSARAQSDTDRARILFEQAQTRIDAGAFAEAITLLEQSMAILPHAPTAYSLAIARIRGGRPVAALDVLAQLRDGAFGQLPDALRADVSARIEEARAAAAMLSVGVRGAASARVSVNGDDWGTVRAGVMAERRLDPGSYDVRAVAPDSRSMEARIELSAGMRIEHVFELAPERTPAERVEPIARPSGAVARDTGDGGGVDPWLVLGIGGAVAVVAASVLLAVVLSGGDDLETHPVFGRPEALVGR